MSRSHQRTDDAQNQRQQTGNPLLDPKDTEEEMKSPWGTHPGLEMLDLDKAGRPRGSILFVANVYLHLVAFHRPFMQLLQHRGYQIHAAASPAQGRKADLQAIGVTCHDIPFARSLLTFRHATAFRTLQTLMAETRFALIHVHTPTAAWLGRLAARRARQGPVLYTAHGFHFYRGAPLLYWLAYYPAERLAARWTDGLLVMNEEDRRRSVQMGFREGDNLFLVHGVGVDLQAHGQESRAARVPRCSLGLSESDFVVSCIAELTKNKNHALLLAAWRRFAEESGSAHLLLIGDGPLRGSLERTIASKAIPRVHLLGFRDDVPALLAASDAVVLSSHREGLPRVIMEAMAASKPVVATNVRGSRDLVDHGSSGLLVPDGDEIGLAKAFGLLASDADLRERMGRVGRESISPYSLERVLAEMDAIYRRFSLVQGTGSMQHVTRE